MAKAKPKATTAHLPERIDDADKGSGRRPEAQHFPLLQFLFLTHGH
jgi:hypothetical protein